jgi:hypothetical protein
VSGFNPSVAIKRLNFNGSQLTLAGLGMILENLNRDGCVIVEGVLPGGSNPFVMGMSLQELAEKLQAKP